MSSTFTNDIVAQAKGFDFVRAHFDCEKNRYSASNPDGYVNFGSAQNQLHGLELDSFLTDSSFRLQDAHYQSFSGTSDCRDAVARYLSDTARADVDSDHIVIGNGLISLLEALGRSLLDAGEKVLVPTPVFPGLVNALTLRLSSGVEFLHRSPTDGFRISSQSIETALREHREAGSRIKALLISSPGNPIGQVLSADELQQIHAIAREYECYLIVDEVYANSCFEGTRFHSAIELDADDVFVLGGLSKDFGLAGFATGWLHCRHDAVRQAVARQSHFFRLSAPIQHILTEVLATEFRNSYLARHQARLTKQYKLASNLLEKAGVKHEATESGLCLWLDLRNHLASLDADGEMELYKFLLNEHRVHISPGSGFKCQHHGYFRICFSQDTGVLMTGIARLAKGLEAFAVGAASCPAS